MYEYRAKVISAYDGDTVRAEVDLGFGISFKGINGKGVSLRLAEIDAPEMRGENKIEGKKSRDFIRQLIVGQRTIIKTEKDKKGKYGRYIVKIYANINGRDRYINALMVEKNHAIYKKY